MRVEPYVQLLDKEGKGTENGRIEYIVGHLGNLTHTVNCLLELGLLNIITGLFLSVNVSLFSAAFVELRKGLLASSMCVRPSVRLHGKFASH